MSMNKHRTAKLWLIVSYITILVGGITCSAFAVVVSLNSNSQWRKQCTTPSSASNAIKKPWNI